MGSSYCSRSFFVTHPGMIRPSEIEPGHESDNRPPLGRERNLSLALNNSANEDANARGYDHRHCNESLRVFPYLINLSLPSRAQVLLCGRCRRR